MAALPAASCLSATGSPHRIGLRRSSDASAVGGTPGLSRYVLGMGTWDVDAGTPGELGVKETTFDELLTRPGLLNRAGPPVWFEGLPPLRS